ncbi:MAG TPA: AtpZ/AtpI family protein [Candidatus Saccharimonadales bacterium]|nr:AtpZ/AtpI family protein [Candidatus Saccharimonadales bacterium]
MTQSPKSKDKTTDQPRPAAILLLITIADTTWRMFAPTIGGTFAGIGLDHIFNTAPWLTITMVILGFAMSMTLVTLQIRKLKK